MCWFRHTSTWIHHRYTRVPHAEPPSLHPPRTIPLGRPSAPAPSNQYHALNLDWWFVSYMILYMFQCHSPKSSQDRNIDQWNKIERKPRDKYFKMFPKHLYFWFCELPVYIINMLFYWGALFYVSIYKSHLYIHATNPLS